jgi:Uma2 family endonuclease
MYLDRRIRSCGSCLPLMGATPRRMTVILADHDREGKPMVLEMPVEMAAAVGPRRWKWTGDDLIALGARGILPPERRFELMDGEIIEIMPPSPRHANRVARVGAVLKDLVRGNALVREEKPIRLDRHFDPQPDVAVVCGTLDDYEERFPGPDEVLLVVEVADTSLDYDRTAKLAAYAAAGIPEFWIVNIREAQVEVYREPDEREYRARRVYKAGESLAPLAFPDCPLPVDDLLGNR